MPLDRYAKRILDMMAAGRGAVWTSPDPVALRRDMERLAQMVDARDVAIAAIENRSIPGPAGPIPVRLYTPLGQPGPPQQTNGGPMGGIVYFHGGTGVFGSLDTHDGLCRILSNASGCRVVAVDYRLAPEHPFPAAIEDSCLATRWIAEHTEHLGLDPTRLAVAGDSHGGTLAAAVALQMRDAGGPQIALQFLLCPVLDLSNETASRGAFATGYFLDASLLIWAVQQYCGATVDLRDPRISPLCATDFAGLPRTHVHTAEFDPMRDEGAAYVRALKHAGVEVHHVCHPGMIHHFYAMAGAIPYARQALESAGAAIRQALDVR